MANSWNPEASSFLSGKSWIGGVVSAAAVSVAQRFSSDLKLNVPVLVHAPAVRQCRLTHLRCDALDPVAHDDRYRLVKYLRRPSVSAQGVQAQPDRRY